MNIYRLARVRAFVECLGAGSISIGACQTVFALTCIPGRDNLLTGLPEQVERLFDGEFLQVADLIEFQVFWAGPQGMGRLCWKRDRLEWEAADFVAGSFSPVVSIVFRGSDLEPGAWTYAFDVERAFLNCRPIGTGLRFDVGGVSGQIVHDPATETLTIVQNGIPAKKQQVCQLVVWVRDSAGMSASFDRELVLALREKYLKMTLDFSPEDLGKAVDMDGLKTVVENPQDLAAILGMGLRLAPRFEQVEPGWEVVRYLLDPVVLKDFGPAACVECDLPISPEAFAPEWAVRVIPEIIETIPKKLKRPSERLAVMLVQEIRAGDRLLPYLLVEPENGLIASAQPFTAHRPLLLLARRGRKVRAIVGDLAGRERLLKLMVTRSGDLALLERQGIVLERYRLQVDLLLAGLWIMTQAVGLTRGEAASLGKLRRQALSVSLATVQEIEAVRKKRLDPAVDAGLEQALSALQNRRRKLLARLGR